MFHVELSSVAQYGSKQLFLVNEDTLISYTTIVGRRHGSLWQLVNKYYSNTTRGQVAWFIKNVAREYVMVDSLD